ncbi:MAG: ABC transporter substrate-binding protein [Proteobacteria bacterium]|uniref:ABC transporter substrate-binding protein n=1 Tax=Candidatus Avisuccinivibrio stercorigallinarum TaxID=2840704 RepID=A0A9D9GRJ1_9GAMM|nr:ABC transporter substrate-binding protein [Candidatus Avisuccinivibrio stercorigallinarum]
MRKISALTLSPEHPLQALLLGALTAAALLTLSACGESKEAASSAHSAAAAKTSTAAAPAPAERPLIYAGEGLTAINPLLNAHDELPNLIFSGLMKYDAAGRPVPDLCTKMKASPDGLAYTFTLRDNLKWQDGSALTAADVVFTYNLIRSPEAALSAIQSNYLDIKSVEALDARTVKFELVKPNAAMPGYFTLGLVPEHLVKGRDIFTMPFNQAPVGSGRYMLESWDRQGGRIILKANPYYYGKKPEIETIVYCTIADESAKSTMLSSGEADLAWLNANYAQSFRGREGWQNIDFKSADLRAISFDFHTDFVKENADSLMLLNYALDKNALVQGVLQGHGFPAYGLLQLNALGQNKEADLYPYNLELFAKMMREAGWEQGADGIYVRDGQRFSFSVQVREYEEERVDLANICSAMLKQAGVEMQVVPVTHFDFKAGYNAYLYGNAAQFDPDAWYSVLHTGGSDNNMSYANAEVDKLLDAGRYTLNENERRAIYQRFELEYAKQPGMVPLVYLEGNYAARAELQGLDTRRLLGHHAAGVFWNVEDWHFASPETRQGE